ncbi:hypothetical protein BDZ89DRAFT_374954 [Hymenopellis radicata]|nr:hypothetical protein BDZ89DRAFT_374954 [Hymenopellis radicata]
MDCLAALVSPPSPAPHPNALLDLLGLDHCFGQECDATRLEVRHDSSTTVSPSQISRQSDGSYYMPRYSIAHCSVESSRRLAASCPDKSGPTSAGGTRSPTPDYESTLVPVLLDMSNSIQPQQKSSFRCPDCTKLYTRRSRLYEHRRSSHNYRPRCEHCLDEFTFVRELKKHVRSKHSLEYCTMLLMKKPRLA